MYGNPYQQMPYQQPVQLIRVDGIQGVNNYRTPANSTIPLFDNNSDVMYIVTTDGSGFRQIRTFTFAEVLPKSPEQFVSRSEYDALQAEISKIKEEMNNGKQSLRKSVKSGDAAE